MLKKRRPLQSKSEIVLRNIVVIFLVVYMLIFLVVPVVIAFAGSFHIWNPLNGTYKWAGLDNYIRMFQYPTFWLSMRNTVVFCAVVVFFRVVLGLALAYAISSKLMKHKTFFRTIFYMPTVTPLVAVAYVWKIMYNPQFGLVNHLFGFDINWLYDSKFALVAVMVMTIWKDFGYAVILFMSGLISIPTDYYEASNIDGANAWQTFRYITLPLLKPTMVFVVITSLISYLQAYVPVMVMTEGGPGRATNVLVYRIYQEGFQYMHYGYASAMAYFLFAVILVVTLIQFRGQKKWVTYM